MIHTESKTRWTGLNLKFTEFIGSFRGAISAIRRVFSQLSTNVALPIIGELGFAVLAAVVFYAGVKRYGVLKTSVFFLGSILWTVPLENFAVLRGAYTYYTFAGDLLPHYPGYLAWLGLLPFWIVLGWFVFSMSGYIIFHDVLLPGRRALAQAAISGLFAVNIDLMMDPIASSNGLWVWLTGSFHVLGVPLFNFVGWFLLIFFYDLIVRHTVLNNQPMKGLGSIERFLLRRGLRADGGMDVGRFVIRIVLLETFIIFFLTFLTMFIDYVAFTVI